jgi:hypothetical protein
LRFDHLNLRLGLLGKKGDAGAAVARTRCTTRTMDVGLSVRWRLYLDNKIDIGYI